MVKTGQRARRNVRFAGQRTRPVGDRRPGAVPLMLAGGFLVLLIGSAVIGTLPWLLVGLYLVASAGAFAAYGLDKWAARSVGEGVTPRQRRHDAQRHGLSEGSGDTPLGVRGQHALDAQMVVQIRPFDTGSPADKHIIAELAQGSRLKLLVPRHWRRNDAAVVKLDVEIAIIEMDRFTCYGTSHPICPQTLSYARE